MFNTQPQTVRAQKATPKGSVVARKLINMTPGNADTPLCRSESGIFRDAVRNVNDDEEEGRQAQRCTLLPENTAHDTSMFEENDILKKCLETYNKNKLNKESFDNFKVTGSSLEASSRVYGQCIDSVHTDVLRTSAGKLIERQQNSDREDAATGGEGTADPYASAGVVEIDIATSEPKQKRICRVTKNKETLNAPLDTMPLPNPVSEEWNSIMRSIISDNKFLNHILPTFESKLRLPTDFISFMATDSKSDTDFTIESTEFSEENGEPIEYAPCDRLMRIKLTPESHLRSLQTDCLIYDTPEVIKSNTDVDAAGEIVSMAFNTNAECEPVAPLNDHPPMLDVDFNDFGKLTTEEHTAINNCRGLRKPPVPVEDMRPVDASSKLEYSYRPLDKISQFWAGPSYWKLERKRARSSTQATLPALRVNQCTGKRSKQLQFDEDFDEASIAIDKFKSKDLTLDADVLNKFQD